MPTPTISRNDGCQRYGISLFALIAGVVLYAMPAAAQDDGSVPPPDNYSSSSDAATGTPDASDTPPSEEGVSFQNFYDWLSNYGTWIETSDYGYVWQPRVSDPNWAPYSEGHWVYTDAGWTWDSDEPWGWATYHYGRWVNIDGTGWCWVPGYTWAPAWVSWRYGDGYAGWAPLPPDSFVGIDYSDDTGDVDFNSGYHIGGDCDNFYGIGAGWYVFLPIRCIGFRHYHGYYCHRGDNYAIIVRTTNVTNINVGRGRGGFDAGRGFQHVTVGGPGFVQVNAVSSTPVPRMTLFRSNQINGGAPGANALAVYAPHVNSVSTAQPKQVAGAIRMATVNRGTDIGRPVAVNSTLAGPSATAAQVEMAHAAFERVPERAKVMTDSSSVRPVLQAPLASMRPLVRPVNSFPHSSPVYNPAPASVVVSPGSTAAPGLNQNERVYPQPNSSGAPVASQSHSAGAGNGTVSHTSVRPATSPYAAPSPSGGYPSGGGYSGGGGPQGSSGSANGLHSH